MKNNILKYIFFIFIVGIIAFSIYMINKKDVEPQIIVDKQENEQDEIVQELKIGAVGIDTLNPILNNNKYAQEISKLVYEPLLNIGPDFELENCLASEWAKTNEVTYVIKIRQGAKWADGSQVTSEDVRFTIDKIKENETIYAYNLQYVIEVQEVDKQTVKITLSEEVPFFEYNLTFPIICKSYCSGEDFNTSIKVKNCIGTGQYNIDTRTDTTLTLRRNENWWNKDNGSSSIEYIKIMIYSDTGEMYNDYKLGKIDVIDSTNIKIENYIGTIGYDKVESAGREYDYIAINTQNNVLTYPEVRQAISCAIDKNELINTVYNGKYKISNYPLDYGNWLYQGKKENMFDTEKAVKILSENGWEYKYNNWQKYVNYATRRLNFRLVVNESNSQRVQVAELIKKQLEYVGIKVTIVKANDSQYESYIQNKNYDMIICGTYISASPDLTRYFGEGNLANFNNEEAMQILNDLKNISDKEMQKEKFKRLEEIYKENVPYISLYNGYNVLVYNGETTGEMKANWFNNFCSIKTWNKK